MIIIIMIIIIMVYSSIAHIPYSTMCFTYSNSYLTYIEKHITDKHSHRLFTAKIISVHYRYIKSINMFAHDEST
jgi:hypothetical protein